MKRIYTLVITILITIIITTTATAEYAMKITKNTKVYENMSTSSKSIKVKKNMSVTLIEQKGKWGKIRNEKNKCVRYIMMKYLQAKSGIQMWANTDCKITKSKGKGKTIKSLQKGDNIKMWITDGNFAYVQTTNGKKGYIQQKNLSYTKINKTENDTTEEDPQSVMPPTDTESEDKISKLLKYANSFLGTPYKQNGHGPTSFDCSNFVAYCYKYINVSLSGALQTQAYTTKNMIKLQSINDCRPGDIMYFNSNEENNKLVDHASLYLGNNKIIHASFTAGKVIISDLTAFYRRTFLWALRPTNL